MEQLDSIGSTMEIMLKNPTVKTVVKTVAGIRLTLIIGSSSPVKIVLHPVPLTIGGSVISRGILEHCVAPVIGGSIIGESQSKLTFGY